MTRRATGYRDAAAIACFFFSGFAALVYEICWIRRASLVFGSTTYSISTVLAVFFLGLAIGSYVFGRIAPRLERPLQWFAFLELGVGLLALVSPFTFLMADALFGVAYRAADQAGALLVVARIGLVAAVLLPSTVLMGGTLPLFCQQYVVRESRIGASVALLYGINTLGGAAGCLAAGLWLIPSLGLRGAIGAGVALSFAVALAVGALGLRAPRREAPEAPPVAGGSRVAGVTVAIIVCLSGFTALGNEVLWTRHLAMLARNTVYTYTLTLGVVLVGIVLGSAAVSLWVDRGRGRAFGLGLLQVVSGLTVLTLMLLPPSVWYAFETRRLLIYAALLLPAAVLSGASFPLAVRLLATDPNLASTRVGGLAAINTLGGIAGSLFMGFVALPALGIQASLYITTGLSLAAGCAAWLVLARSTPLWARGTLVTLACAAWLAIPSATGTRIPADFFSRQGRLVDYREGLASNVAVIAKKTVLELYIDRMWQGTNARNQQPLAAHIPMALHAGAQRILVVGAGAGQTPSRFLMYDIEHLDCVDIEPAVFEMIRAHFDADWMQDPRVSLVPEDGRNHVAHGTEKYDLISVEVGQIHRPGVPYFYTVEFYRDAREHLMPGGVISQYVPLQFFSLDQFKAVIRTFLEVFPQSMLWYNTSELLLIGANASTIEISTERLDLQSTRETIRDDLARSHWGGPAHWLNDPLVFLGGFLVGPRGLAELAVDADIYRDDRPVLDYATAREGGAQRRVVAGAKLLAEHLEPVEAWVDLRLSSEERGRIEEIQRANTGDVAATGMLQIAWGLWGSDPNPVIAALSAALRWNPGNFVANIDMAKQLLRVNRITEARRYFALAVGIRPGHLGARNGLARTLRQMGRVQASIPHFQAAVELDGGDPSARHELAGALARVGRLEEAIHQLEEALRLRPDLETAQNDLERLRAEVEKTRETEP
jgi:spermidine synthase